jgi:peptidoglycan hydrolase-like protein with peptidoglycan-binding domain
MKTLMSLVTAVVCAGCLHTREVETGAPQEEEKPEEAKAAADPAPAKKPTAKTKSPAVRPPVEEGRPELSVSPAGLLLPEGPALIQQALAKRGYLPAGHQTGTLDQETSGALRKFQGDEKLAKTGSPDRETVRRLGLTVGKVFRNAKDQEPSASRE